MSEFIVRLMRDDISLQREIKNCHFSLVVSFLSDFKGQRLS